MTAAISFGTLRNTSEYTAPFEDLGLSMVDNRTVNPTYNTPRDDALSIITYCLGIICDARTYDDLGACDPCRWEALFGSEAEFGSAYNCLSAICSPRGSLDPDLGGIGVSIRISIHDH